MSHPNAALLRELEAHGAAHDAQTPDHGDRLLNITADTGAFLAVLLRACRARRILEIGTSNGYSTLLARRGRPCDPGAGDDGGADAGEGRARQGNVREGQRHRADLVEVAEAGEALARTPTGEWDFIFLDADRGHYLAWWPDLRRALAPGGLLVVDNAVSHAAEVAAFIAAVTADAELSSVLVPIGKGEFVACKSGA